MDELLVDFTLLFHALWAGSLTPVAITTFRTSVLSIPNYANVSTNQRVSVRDWITGTLYSHMTRPLRLQCWHPDGRPTRVLTILRNSARQMVLVSIKSWTTLVSHTSVVHTASVRRWDCWITPLLPTLSLFFYSYIKDGYEATTACAYNESSGFILRDTTNVWVFEAYGELPDSDAGPEESSYIGHAMDSIAALGVVHFATSPAAGPGSENESQQVVSLRRFIAVCCWQRLRLRTGAVQRHRQH